MRIGGPLFENVMKPVDLVQAHRKYGYSAVYLPLVEDRSLQRDMVAALQDADIVISETGAYCINILDTDESLRQKNIQEICRRLAMADEYGVLCCVMHGGTVEMGGWGKINPQNLSAEAFEKTVTTIQQIIDSVAPKRTKLVLEASSWLLPESPQSYLRIINAVNRKQFGVHLDPVNILDSPRACYFNAEVLREYFRLLGPYIVSCHSKDVLLSSVYLPIEITETFTGNGLLDYDTYLTELSKLPQEAPLMLEHLEAHQVEPAMSFLLATARRLGITVKSAENFSNSIGKNI